MAREFPWFGKFQNHRNSQAMENSKTTGISRTSGNSQTTGNSRDTGNTREIPETREFPRSENFPPISRETGNSREFPARGFPLNIAVTKLVRQLQPLLQRPHSTANTGLHSELWCSFTQPSSACTFVFVGQVQLRSLWFSRQNISNDIQRSTAVHYLYGQFSQPF